MNQDISPLELRKQIRSGAFTGNTSGYSKGYVQGNLCVLPADWANDFLQFCQSNPKPCPLIGMSSSPGEFNIAKLGNDLDIRTDIPSYKVAPIFPATRFLKMANYRKKSPTCAVAGAMTW